MNESFASSLGGAECLRQMNESNCDGTRSNAFMDFALKIAKKNSLHCLKLKNFSNVNGSINSGVSAGPLSVAHARRMLQLQL